MVVPRGARSVVVLRRVPQRRAPSARNTPLLRSAGGMTGEPEEPDRSHAGIALAKHGPPRPTPARRVNPNQPVLPYQVDAHLDIGAVLAQKVLNLSDDRSLRFSEPEPVFDDR